MEVGRVSKSKKSRVILVGDARIRNGADGLRLQKVQKEEVQSGKSLSLSSQGSL